MAIYGDNIISGRVNDVFCDAATDITDLPDFAEEWNLKPGSTCLCASNSSVYQLLSDGTWKML